ncbi:MAG: YggS family pyridoxal phosphate-dependent enzyme [Chloroflexota bacterium]|nr:YggS family pyridoxal phosphate-dependent enzyme [Chloroflexota bacterium]
MNIAENIAQVYTNIQDACTRAHRDITTVRLIAVSKTHPPEAVIKATAAGVQHFGENRVEEAESKLPAVSALTDVSLHWHMVGHLQSRKAKDALTLFGTIHSVDSYKLAEKLSRLAVEHRRSIALLLETNVSGEASKYGFQAAGWEQDDVLRESLFDAWRQIAELPGIEVRGLMTMAPIVTDMEDTRPVFASLRRLRDAMQETQGIALPELSMGMTDDYPVAIEEGATMVRIGRAIFGERNMR